MKENIYKEDYLLMRLHERDDEATEDFYYKYERAIKYKAYKYKYYGSKIGLELADLVQEGYIGLSQAVEDYTPIYKASFYTFASICIEREIQNCVAAASRKKHQYLNESISIDATTMQGVAHIDLIDNRVQSPDEEVMNRLQEHQDYMNIIESLTELERKIFVLKYNNYNYQEISEILNLELKVVDNALQRIKKKVRLIID